MYKHYIRIDIDNNIIDGYSDAFREYQDGDICIYEGEEFRQLFLLDNIINPNLFDILGNPKYFYLDGEIIEVI